MVCLIGAPRCYINIAKDGCTPPSWKPNYTTALFQPQWESAAYIWTPQISSTVVNCQVLVRLESSTMFNGIMIFNLCLTYVIEHGPYTTWNRVDVYVTKKASVHHLRSEIAGKRGRLLVICALIVLNLKFARILYPIITMKAWRMFYHVNYIRSCSRIQEHRRGWIDI